MAITKIPAAGFTGNNFKNIIINGDMSIAQRGTSASGITSQSYYTLDRWNTILGNLGTWTQSQDTDVPTGQGFATSLKMDCTTADASPAVGGYLRITQKIEGQNVQYLKKGTSNAESVTVSFWVKSNKTGTYICWLRDIDNSRSISKSYTINDASTWEKKTITYAGDTTGTLDNDNGTSLQLEFWLGAGSDFTSGTLQTSWNTDTAANRAVGQVNLADSTANEFYITGVQLEAGTTASDFEFLPYDVNLRRCMRYYQEQDLRIFICARYNAGTGISLGDYYFPVPMRAAPTAGTSGTFTSSAGYIGTPSFGAIRDTALYLQGPSIGANEIEYCGGGFITMSAEL
jgi:hypothetical protein